MVADVYYETSFIGDNITDKKGHFEKDGEPVAISFFWQGSQREIWNEAKNESAFLRVPSLSSSHNTTFEERLYEMGLACR